VFVIIEFDCMSHKYRNNIYAINRIHPNLQLSPTHTPPSLHFHTVNCNIAIFIFFNTFWSTDAYGKFIIDAYCLKTFSNDKKVNKNYPLTDQFFLSKQYFLYVKRLVWPVIFFSIYKLENILEMEVMRGVQF